jgi:hypothetical protein
MRRIPSSTCLLAALGLLLLAGRTGAQPPPRLLLLDIEPQGVPAELASSLTGLLELEIERGGLYEVVGEGDVRLMLQEEERRILLGDEGFEGRMSEIGKRAQTPYTLAASLGRVGSLYLLSLRLLDVEQARVVRRVSQTLAGEEEGLLGSLRAAALALTLEEKGVAPDISQGLIDDLAIAEKAKTAFFGLSFVYDADIGWNTASGGQDLLVLRPQRYALRIDAELPIWRWLRAFGSLGADYSFSTVGQKDSSQFAQVFEVGADDPAAYLLQAVAANYDYDALRLPLHLGIKAVPATGRFLPYALVGLGFSWNRFGFSGSRAVFFSEAREEGQQRQCQAPYGDHPENGELCSLALDMRPEGDKSFFAFELTAAAGAEWLLTPNLGLKLEARYAFSLALSSAESLRVTYSGESEPYTATIGGLPRQVTQRLEQIVAVQDQLHLLGFSIGLVAYW